MLHYNIPEFSDCDEFLSLLAKRTGRLKKGGVPNLNAAARNVLLSTGVFFQSFFARF